MNWTPDYKNRHRTNNHPRQGYGPGHHIEIRRRAPQQGYVVLPRFAVCRDCGSVAEQGNTWSRIRRGPNQVGISGEYRCPRCGKTWELKRSGGRSFRFQDQEWVYFDRL